MKKVVSVSLGSSKRDHTVQMEILGETFEISRRGTDGDFAKAVQLLRELDGKVDAIGLGGIDVYLVAGGRRYAIKDGLRLLRTLKVTPACDGSGLKNTLERKVVAELFRAGILRRGQRVLLVSAVDRFGMAEALVENGAEVIFGDLIFALGIPVPLRSLRTVAFLAALVLPVLGRLSFKLLYPTGQKQEKETPKYGRYYDWAEVVAGDFHYIKRYLPPRIPGKIILTNTTTKKDELLLKERGAKMLITTTPELQGRSFGTNVMEAVFLALLGKKWEEVTPADYLTLIEKIGLGPSIRVLRES
ncbi:quinate 5-dehydrogenase [Thermodesulfitimonas autotrophica]|uniref:quinate 5-dehydrogenase n=1 Tax=Thermodesulfitimonas autotrophica TaxID=1894989 RepID=UPI002FE20A97